MITVTTVKALAATATAEQIGRCAKVFGPDNKPFYMVESESDPTTEYKVTWDREYGFRCTCKAGQHGFIHCQHGVCKHVVWSVAASMEEKAALLEQSKLQIAAQEAEAAAPEHVGTVNGRQIAPCELDDLMNRQPAKPSPRAKGFSGRAFSILR